MLGLVMKRICWANMRKIKSNLGPFESVGCADKLGVLMKRISWAKMGRLR